MTEREWADQAGIKAGEQYGGLHWLAILQRPKLFSSYFYRGRPRAAWFLALDYNHSSPNHAADEPLAGRN
jgi:hypothetical protein